jgi:hypothetical protein
MVTLAQQLKAELGVLPKIDASLPDASNLANFRAFWVEAHLRNPAAFEKYDVHYDAAIMAPLGKRDMQNVRRVRASERKARRWFKTKQKKDVGNWKLTERDWSGFFASLVEFFSAIAPLFATCGL